MRHDEKDHHAEQEETPWKPISKTPSLTPFLT